MLLVLSCYGRVDNHQAIQPKKVIHWGTICTPFVSMIYYVKATLGSQERYLSASVWSVALKLNTMENFLAFLVVLFVGLGALRSTKKAPSNG